MSENTKQKKIIAYSIHFHSVQTSIENYYVHARIVYTKLSSEVIVLEPTSTLISHLTNKMPNIIMERSFIQLAVNIRSIRS